MSGAMTDAPVEIWADIFDQVLYDPVLFRTDLFYPRCNFHSALREWYDPANVQNYRNQRDILRLVSRSWKGLIDSRHQGFLQHITSNIAPRERSFNEPVVNSQLTTMIKQQWRHARRIHVDIHSPSCGKQCVMGCICRITRYITPAGTWLEENDYSGFEQLIIELSRDITPLSVEILILEAKVWDIMNDILSQDTLARLFSNVRALEIAYSSTQTIRISSLFTKLTYLSILDQHHIEKKPVKFPHLKMLRLELKHRTGQAVPGWDMPLLQHMELHTSSDTLFSNSGTGFDFIRRGWPFLLSLAIITTGNNVEFPQDIWNSLPNLEYLACHPRASLAGNGFTPDPDYPLRIIGFMFFTKYRIKEEALMVFISHMVNLKIVADFHRWEDVVLALPPATPASSLKHSCGQRYCQACIIEMDSFCTTHNLRYEDRWGRSLEEFRGAYSL